MLSYVSVRRVERRLHRAVYNLVRLQNLEAVT